MLTQPMIAVGAALASALLFLVAAQGSIASGLVAYFTPLPIMIAALGWGHRLGLLAMALASAFFLTTLSLVYIATYGLAFGLPGWGLAYLALLARDVAAEPGASPVVGDARLWYPLGHLVLWAAGAASAVVFLSLIANGLDSDGGQTYATAARVASLLRKALNVPGAPPSADVAALAAVLLRVLPIATAASLTLLYLVNLWLAGRVVQLSGRLVRPWSALPESLRLPRWAAAVFAAAVGLSAVLPGGAKTYAMVVAAALGVGFALQAFAFLHAVSRPLRARGAILTAVYVAAAMFIPFSLVALVALGVADVLRPLTPRAVAARGDGGPPLT